MEKMKKSHPEIEISVPGVEYQNFGGYRLLMCTDPVKMALMDPESDFGQSIESYMGSSFLYLYNDLIDAGKWISHKTALILVLQYRTEQLVTEMLERDGLNIPGLTSTNYEDLFEKKGQGRVDLQWLFESYREQAAEEARKEMIIHARPYVEIDFDEMFLKK